LYRVQKSREIRTIEIEHIEENIRTDKNRADDMNRMPNGTTPVGHEWVRAQFHSAAKILLLVASKSPTI